MPTKKWWRFITWAKLAKKFLLENTRVRQRINYEADGRQISDSLENLRVHMCFAVQGLTAWRIRRDALDQVKKLRLAARSQPLNCDVHADRGNVRYYGSWCYSLSFFCEWHQRSFWAANSVVVARRNSGLLPLLRTPVFYIYIDVNF